MIADVQFPPIDGRIYREACSLMDDGHDVRLLHASLPEKNEKKVEKYKRIVLHRIRLKERYTGFEPLDFFLEYKLFAWRTLLRLPKIRKHFNFDSVHVHNPPDNIIPVIWLYCKLKGIKIVFDVHDPMPELLDHRINVFGKPLLVLAARILQWMSLKLSDKVIVTNDSSRERYKKLSGKDSNVVMNVPRGNFEKTDKKRVLEIKEQYSLKGKKVIIYQGAIIVNRGIKKLIDSMKTVLAKEKNAVLLLVGAGDLLEECKIHAARKEYSDKIIFTGHINFDDLMNYTAASDVTIISYDPSPLIVLSTSNKSFEYALQKRPIVTVKLPEIVNVLGEYAYWVEDLKSSEAMGEKILEALGDKDSKKRVKAAYARVKDKFNWELMAERLRKVYEE